ncbi:hypothetical protein BDR05DRAFT_494474 [Suillus weaverae]|nr:hypothetical protein BDR05DRAFT_494474 [Suillus weaverae]
MHNSGLLVLGVGTLATRQPQARQLAPFSNITSTYCLALVATDTNTLTCTHSIIRKFDFIPSAMMHDPSQPNVPPRLQFMSYPVKPTKMERTILWHVKHPVTCRGIERSSDRLK